MDEEAKLSEEAMQQYHFMAANRMLQPQPALNESTALVPALPSLSGRGSSVRGLSNCQPITSYGPSNFTTVGEYRNYELKRSNNENNSGQKSEMT